jgi:hypothetical protein
MRITRKALYDWEYQFTNYKEYMLIEVAKAADYDLANMPERVQQKAEEDALIREKIKREKDKRDALARIEIARKPSTNLTTLARRAKMDAANPRASVPPPTANRPHPVPPPATCKKGARMGEIDSLGDPRNIPFPPDYVHDPKNHRIPKQYVNLVNFPDLVYEARQTMQPYEVRFIPRHSTPYHSSDNGLILRPAAWYTVNKTGKMGMGETQAEAMERAEQLRAEDDKLCADLL